MGMFLNSIAPCEQYRDVFESRYFVDKSLLIEEVISAMTVNNQRYLCITRPRRFGKSVMANMLAAFFGNAVDDRKNYLAFLRDLLKGQAYVELAYMTGVLPIAKYSSGSEINMFKEYDRQYRKCTVNTLDFWNRKWTISSKYI